MNAEVEAQEPSGDALVQLTQHYLQEAWRISSLPRSTPSADDRATDVDALVDVVASLADGPSPLHLSSLVEVLTRRLATEQRLTLAKWILLDAIPDDPGPVPAARSSRRAEEVRRKGSILRVLDTLKAGEVGRIIAPGTKEPRSTVARLRAASKVLGLPLGQRPDYHYPAFQFDEDSHEVTPIVAYANMRLGAASDPWGVASWWITPSELFDGWSPLDLLRQNKLTQIAVDNVAADDAEGM